MVHLEEDENETMGPALEAMLNFGLGFPREACEVALEQCDEDVQAAIEFCLEHAMEMDVLIQASQQKKALAKASRRGGGDAARSAIINKLLEMGFPERWCNKAIDVVGDSFDNALTWILGNGELLQSEDNAEQEKKKTDDRSQADEAQDDSSSQAPALVKLPAKVGTEVCYSRKFGLKIFPGRTTLIFWAKWYSIWLHLASFRKIEL